MTMSTSSADATALPDRRHFLSTIAGAGALGLPVLPALAAPCHLDAALIELDGLLALATELSADLATRCDDAYEGFVPPPMPEPLFWRKSDFLTVWIDKTRLDGVGNADDGTERLTYYSDGVLQSLRESLAWWLAVPPIDRNVGDSVIARVEEIIAHIEAYEVEEAKALADCGFTAASEADKRQRAVIESLLQRVVATPARTAEGVCIKTRAALSASYRSADFLEQHQLPRLLAKAAKDELAPGEMAEMLSLSAMIDAVRVGGPPTSGRRAAA